MYYCHFINTNWIRKYFNIDILRKVYFYERGNIELGLEISDSLYHEALDYVKERQLKKEEFLRKIAELQETSKNQLNEFINEDLSTEDANLVELENINKNLETKFERLEQTVAIKMKNMDSNLQKLEQTVITKIRNMDSRLQNLEQNLDVKLGKLNEKMSEILKLSK